MFCFPNDARKEYAPLSFHKLCVYTHLNKTKFERNSSLDSYHTAEFYHWPQKIKRAKTVKTGDATRSMVISASITLSISLIIIKKLIDRLTKLNLV